MFHLSACCLLVALVSACGGVYVYFPSKVRYAEAEAKCQRYGMVLLELRSQDELQRWNTLKSTLFDLVQSSKPKREEPWLGLKHDGSKFGNESNYRWQDGSPVTFLSWPVNTAEPDNLPAEDCVRIRKDHFGTKQCRYFGFSTVCQEQGSSGPTVTIEAFRRTFFKETSQQIFSHYSLLQVPLPTPALWLVARPDVPSVAKDATSCVMLCGITPSQNCLASFHHVQGCTVMDMVNLTTIRDP